MPKPLIIEHFCKDIADIVFLINRVKGNPHMFHWENWMYYFIQKIVEGDIFIDWADLIAEKLHKELLNVTNLTSFYMSSYLIYILAYF